MDYSMNYFSDNFVFFPHNLLDESLQKIAVNKRVIFLLSHNHIRVSSAVTSC